MGIIKAICISDRRGIQKECVESATFEVDWGIVGDAHGGDWHRQVSLLSYDKIEDFKNRGAQVHDGAFGENLIVEGFDFRALPVGTILRCNDVVLEMTQIGKQCHTHCQIYHKMGECIMPTQGVFAKVIQGGTLAIGDEMVIDEALKDQRLRAAVMTLSDKGSRGEREDLSGALAKEMLEEKGYRVVETILLPDDQAAIEKELRRLADQRQMHLIVTTGGTGLSSRDCTPEATLAVATRHVPGIAEAIRVYGMQVTPKAMLSRGCSVIRDKTLIINLPGSPKAVRENLGFVLPHIEHGIRVLIGEDSECGSL